MNKKLILRAANQYYQWLEKQVNSPPQTLNMILKRLEKSQYNLNQIKKWTEKLIASQSPRVQMSYGNRKTIQTALVFSDELSTCIPKDRHIGLPNFNLMALTAYDTISVSTLNIEQFVQEIMNMVADIVRKPQEPPVSMRQCLEEINAIANNWEDVQYKNGNLTITIKRVSLEDESETVELGDFVVSLCLSQPENGLKIKSINNCLSSGGYPHPHIKGNSLCEGEGTNIMADALSQGRLEDYFRTVETILRTYNDESPYEPLCEWYDPNHDDEFYCERCGEWRSDESSVICECCQHQFCEYCSEDGISCESCNSWSCVDCVISCDGCNRGFCENCVSGCTSCDQPFCEECLSQCSHCGNDICPDCTERCNSCEAAMCKSCVQICPTCKEHYCDECLSNTCSDCNQNFCDDCISSCDDCGEIICKQCEKQCCEACSIKLCSKCKDKNEKCLLSCSTENDDG